MSTLKEPSSEYVLEMPVAALASRKTTSIPRIRVPSGFAWLKHLDAEEQIEFFSGLLMAMFQAQQTGNWEPVSELIEEWKVTAGIYADPVTMQSLEKARQERAQGEVVSFPLSITPTLAVSGVSTAS